MNTPWTLIRGATSRLVVLCSVVALTFGSVAPANASPSPTVYAFYEMRDADAWITANTPSHTGLYVRRPDIVPLSGQDPQPCAQSPYYVNSLYYPSTILISLHMGNWADTIAMGTGHGCVGHRYWYWAYTTFFVWHHLGEEWNIPIQTNFFDIHRLRDEFWRFEINGVNKYAMFWNTNAMDVAAQFESQDPNKAANIANALADTYISTTLDAKLKSTKIVGDWLQDRLTELKAQAAAAAPCGRVPS